MRKESKFKRYKQRKRQLNRERKAAREIYLSRYPAECIICGYNVLIQIHHIRELSTFKDPKHGNSFENLAGLCPNHHCEYHYGILSETTIRAAMERMDERLGLIPVLAA